MEGSVMVKVGDSISDGQLIGKVGNSGSTFEPHLHIHVLRDDRRGKRTVPILFGGRFLTRLVQNKI
ncbi:MAG: M23 family metallopeptidase [Nitrospirota bacterium]